MSGLVILPILAALGAGVLGFVLPPRAGRGVLIGGALAHLAATIALFVTVESHGPQALHVGGWTAPLGIALAADLFSATVVLLCGVLGFACALQTAGKPDGPGRSAVPSLVLFLLAGVDAAFLTADLFHLYVAFEVVLLSSFVLFVSGGGAERWPAAVRYMIPGILSSMLLLAGVGLTYGLTGTLFLPDIADRVREIGPSPAVSAVAGVLAVAFALKAALFPAFAWLPASYPAAPTAVVALFSGLLTKIGVYALVRTFTLVFPGEMHWVAPVLLVVACVTMVVGVLGALAQWDMQKLLCFHVVSQVGYLVVGIGLGTVTGLASVLFYLVHNSVAKTGLLLATDVVRERRGTDALKKLGGLARTDPVLAALFFVAALALAGLPPLSGFWAKLMVLTAAVGAREWFVLGVAAGVGVLTLMSMTKIWTKAFWGEEPASAKESGPERLPALVPFALLAVLTIVLGLGAGPGLDVAQRAAEQLLDPAAYLEALGRTR